MSNSDILIKLREMHEELSAINDDLKSVEYVNEETIDALGQLVTDASVLVDQARQAKDDETSLAERHDLLDRVMKFETDHPRVTRFLSQITDVLAMIGI
jgi:hypothetical protein